MSSVRAVHHGAILPSRREARRVIETMAQHRLERGVNGLQIYLMCEIPNNVIQIGEFAKWFDGFSIGSNNLTQLTLGVDRDSDIVAFECDERDPGMQEMLQLAATGATAATSASAGRRRRTIRRSPGSCYDARSIRSVSIRRACCAPVH